MVMRTEEDEIVMRKEKDKIEKNEKEKDGGGANLGLAFAAGKEEI